MSGSREQRRAAESTETSAVELAQLALIPDLQLLVAGNPAAPDEIIDWLIQHGSNEVRAVLDPGNSQPPVPSAVGTPEVPVDEDGVDGPIWELEEESEDSPPPALAALNTSAPRPRRGPEADDLWEQEQEYRRRRRLTSEQRRAEDAQAAIERAAAREQADLVARASEIQRWEAAYALAHDGAKPPPGFAPPIAFSPAGSREVRTNGMAIAAFILALVGVSLLGLIFGHLARGQIQRTGDGGSGFALAGIVLGWIGVVGNAILLIWYVTVLT